MPAGIAFLFALQLFAVVVVVVAVAAAVHSTNGKLQQQLPQVNSTAEAKVFMASPLHLISSITKGRKIGEKGRVHSGG